jgi:uncharacterized cofD-like protein
METLRIVGIGGGTGLPVLLQGLRKVAGVEVSAIVSVADNGGSSGRLRQSFAIPAVGDLRNCLVALAGNDCVLADLFQHRFASGIGLEGHSLGNLIVTALYQMSGSLEQAIEIASRLLPLQGRALPVTETPTTLCAAFHDGTVVHGESQITAARRRIQRIWLEPDNPPPFPGVLETIASADVLVFGPGSLYTSVLPNLLVAGVADAVEQSRAVKIFVCNLMTQPGETDGFSAADHLRILETCLGRGAVDFCIVNTGIAAICSRLPLEAGSAPVTCDVRQIESRGAIPIQADLLTRSETGIRHDPARLGNLVVNVARGALGMRAGSHYLPNPASPGAQDDWRRAEVYLR